MSVKNLKPFKKGFDERRNLSGAPKKTYKNIINNMESLGYIPPTQQEYYRMLTMLLVMTESDLKAFAKNDTNPHWIRTLIVDLNDKKIRQRMMKEIQDWLFGSSKRQDEIEDTTKSFEMYSKWLDEAQK